MMGDMEMIFPDNSGIVFTEEGVEPEVYDYCDKCGKLINDRYLFRYPHNGVDLIWIRRNCYKKVE